MAPDNSPSTNRFDKIDDKLNEISDKLTSLELQMTKKVDRNTLILNGMLWFIGIVVTANVICLARYLW